METPIHRVYRHHPAQHSPARHAPEHRQAENLHWRPQQQAAQASPALTPTERRPWRSAEQPTPRQPRFAPRRKPRGRARWWRALLLLALIVPGLAWLYAQAPRLFPFAARHGAHPGLLLLVVVALVVVGGLKQVVSFKTMQRVAPTLSEFSEE
ncbi:MAG TPA: hypothetical protein PKZ84_06610 [Anaerolineae bacterium]|nr:hypothetical protein [Anaerolineae bacterium]HQI83358.1 hypothetical protein [Anaerolineae bacterium]